MAEICPARGTQKATEIETEIEIETGIEIGTATEIGIETEIGIGTGIGIAGTGMQQIDTEIVKRRRKENKTKVGHLILHILWQPSYKYPFLQQRRIWPT